MWSPMPPRALSGHALAVGQLDGQAGAGPEGPDVVGGAVAVLAAQAVAADAAVDEARMAGDRGRRLEPEAVERVGAQVGEEDVRRRQQLLEPLPGRRLAQVEDDAALAAVVLGEGRVREVLADAERAERAAHRVPVRRLHLDDVGAPVGQERARRRCRHPHAHLDHTQTGQRGQPGPFGLFWLLALLGLLGRGHRASPPVRPEACVCARSVSFITFPVAFSGSASTISTTRGTL